MGDLPKIDELLKRNREYATNQFEAKPRLLDRLKGNTGPKWSQILIIACLDARCDPHAVLGITDAEASIIRNVSGRFAPAAHNIPGLDTLLNLEQIILLQHSDCASTFASKDQVLADIKSKRPEITEDELRKVKTQLPLHMDNTDALAEDLQAVRNCPFLRKGLAESVVGLYLDSATGLVKQVK